MILTLRLRAKMPNMEALSILIPQLQNHKDHDDSDLEVAGKDAEYGGPVHLNHQLQKS
jgi:hypothetical protein